jgi:hypothetical protein
MDGINNNKDEFKTSLDSFGNNFSFNVTAILIFSLFLNLNKETLILVIGLIINTIVSYGSSFVLNAKYIQQFFCKNGCQNPTHALESMQLFGFLTGYYTLNRMIKFTNMKWVICFGFLILVSFLFSNKYAHDNFNISSIIIMWSVGFLMGGFAGYLSGKSALTEALENAPKNINNATGGAGSASDATCSNSNQNDYVCQAFKDGKVYNA